MGIKIGFFVVLLLIAGAIWIFDLYDKRKDKKPTVDELIETINTHIKEIQESANASSEEAKAELARCKIELNKLKNIKIKTNKK